MTFVCWHCTTYNEASTITHFLHHRRIVMHISIYTSVYVPVNTSLLLMLVCQLFAL